MLLERKQERERENYCSQRKKEYERVKEKLRESKRTIQRQKCKMRGTQKKSREYNQHPTKKRENGSNEHPKPHDIKVCGGLILPWEQERCLKLYSRIEGQVKWDKLI